MSSVILWHCLIVDDKKLAVLSWSIKLPDSLTSAIFFTIKIYFKTNIWTVGEKSKHEANSSLTTAFDSVELSCTILKPQYLLLPCQIQPWCSSRLYPWSTFQLPLKQVIHVHNLVQHSSAGTHLSKFIKSCLINSWNSVMINLISTKN